MQRRITKEQFGQAVEYLTEKAKVEETVLVRDAAETLAALIDPDGAEPNQRNQHLQRVFTLGSTRADGMTTGRFLLTPEHLAVITELLESQRRNSPLIRTTPGGDEHTDTPDPEWR